MPPRRPYVSDDERRAIAERLGALVYGPRPELDPGQVYAAQQFGYRGPVMTAEPVETTRKLGR